MGGACVRLLVARDLKVYDVQFVKFKLLHREITTATQVGDIHDSQCLFDGYNKDRNHPWPYLFNGYSEERDRKRTRKGGPKNTAWPEFQAGGSSTNSRQKRDRDGSLERASGLERWRALPYSLMHAH